MEHAYRAPRRYSQTEILDTLSSLKEWYGLLVKAASLV